MTSVHTNKSVDRNDDLFLLVLTARVTAFGNALFVLALTGIFNFV